MSTTPPLPGQPLPFRMMLDEAMARVRRHFRAMYWPVAVPAALAMGSMSIVQALWMNPGRTAQNTNPGELIAGALGFVAVVFLAMAVYILCYVALLASATDALAGRPVSMARAWRFALRPFTILTVALSSVAIFIGFLFCVIPGIWLALLFSLVVPVMVDELRSGPEALGRSIRLARYNPRREFSGDPCARVFILSFVGALLGYALSFIVQFPFMAVQWLAMFRAMSQGERTPQDVLGAMMWLQVPGAIAGGFAQMLVNLYVSFGIALIYFDIKHRKEGTDLESAIALIAERPSRFGRQTEDAQRTEPPS